MDGTGDAPAPAPAGRALSDLGESCLTAAAIVVLLLYLTGRFVRLYNKDAAAAASSSPPAPAPSSQPVTPLASLLPVVVHVASAGGAERAAQECAVCLAEFGERAAGRLLPRCGHEFHEECIATWLRVRSTCPLCRVPVATKLLQ